MNEEKWLEKECKKLKLPYCSPTYPLNATDERKRIQTLRQSIAEHRGKLLCVAKLKCEIRKRRKPSRMQRQNMLPHQTQELTTNETLTRTPLRHPVIANESYHLPPQNFPSHLQQESILRSLPFFSSESIGNSTPFPNDRGNDMLFPNIHALLQQYPYPMAPIHTANVGTNYLDIMTGLTSVWYPSTDRRLSLGEVYPRNTMTEHEVRHNDLNDDNKVISVFCNGGTPTNPSETLNRSFSFRRKQKQKRSSSSKLQMGAWTNNPWGLEFSLFW
jgi:hypothetical protein